MVDTSPSQITADRGGIAIGVRRNNSVDYREFLFGVVVARCKKNEISLITFLWLILIVGMVWDVLIQ